MFTFIFLSNLMAEEVRACLILGLDGVRYDAFAKARTPCIDRLGAAALAQTQLTADCWSAPGWTSVLTGLEATTHGALTNNVVGTIERGRGTLLARARRELGRKTAALCEWNPLLARIIEDGALDVRVGGPAEVVEAAAIEVIRQRRADMIFVHLDEVDHEGHATGFDPANARYVAAIEAVDARVGRILDALATAASDVASCAATAAPSGAAASPPLAIDGAARLRCTQSRAFTPVWSTPGRGEAAPCGVWRPKLAAGEVFFGDFVTTSPAYPFGCVATIAPECGAVEALLRRARSFKLRWHREAVGDAPPLFVWSAVAPDGFVALGFVATTTEEAPSAEHFRCVAECALRPAAARGGTGDAGPDPFQLWNSGAVDAGAREGAAPPAAFWRSAVPGVARVRVGTPHSGRGAEGVGWCLRSEDAAAAPSAAAAAPGGAAPARAPATAPATAPREWLVVFAVDHGGEGLEHGARNAANRRIPQRFAVGTFDAAAGAMRWRDAPRDDARPAPNRRRVPSHLDVHRRVLRWLGAPASSAANCAEGTAAAAIAATTARRALHSSADPRHCLCGCNPPAPSMFEMARRRKEAREAKAQAAAPTSLQQWLTRGGGGGGGSVGDVAQI